MDTDEEALVRASPSSVFICVHLWLIFFFFFFFFVDEGAS